MKIKKFFLLLVIFPLVFTLLACEPDSGVNNAASVKPVSSETTNDGSPTKLKWSANQSSHVRIVDGGMHPKTQTVSFDFGYDTVGMKKQGYTKLNFQLEFDVYVDSGLMVSTTVEAYFTNSKKAEFGVGWNNLTFTNTNAYRRSYDKTIDIDNLLQNRGKIYLTFTAVKNTLMTGTYISGIELTVIAE